MLGRPGLASDGRLVLSRPDSSSRASDLDGAQHNPHDGLPSLKRPSEARTTTATSAVDRDDARPFRDPDSLCDHHSMMDRDRRLTGLLRGQSDNPIAPPGFELNNPWRAEKRMF
ncbi:hypothetical protein GGTG_01204 [Gaeumannomyces tritici R3-111a-1]|uniref:Uncharacterized protein n=1 Tax=Gaeumannomyces tritici (strain R3-111a-1) TaxID=644352 RepID=J3NIX0_GAET3|nr:hypothetical protein GGTG_01204 [Gaeumannomyces tritici R3-111a-1]EJT81220.1 hypothetical protein GGTG_01204 [Gaeumannomyces tritici R3-111a-1]